MSVAWARFFICAATGALLATSGPAPVCAAGAAPTGGESIYRRGVLASGKPLSATRAPDLRMTGADAACGNCHRRSGLGEIEGHIAIPPIAGPYLFHPRAADRDDLDLPFVDGMRPDRDPYTDDTLARAIRTGIGADGRPLNYLMPQYSLDDADMAALISYLRSLLPGRVPGVTDSELNFATIIAPDADPVKRKGMLDVLDHYFADKNSFVRAAAPRLRSSHRMMFKASRRWRLHVWDLAGPPESWERQLIDDLQKDPVFAVISGLGGKDWAPVHRFCEQASLPCLFPNVELPVVAERDFYSVYFSKGVLLEAGLMAHQIMDAGRSAAWSRVVQVFRAGDIGEAAAKSLHEAMADSGIQTVERRMNKGADGRQLQAALRDAAPGDTLVLWLRPADLASLSHMPVHRGSVIMSGLMGGLGMAPVAEPWRSAVRMAYPFDLPDKRRIRVDYPLGWFAVRHIPVVDEQVQTDTYLACGLLSETLSHMADSFMRDYLVERVEGMLEHRIITGYYPRLTLAPNERFASKGGFIVHFAQAAGTQVAADTEWLVP